MEYFEAQMVIFRREVTAMDVLTGDRDRFVPNFQIFSADLLESIKWMQRCSALMKKITVEHIQFREFKPAITFLRAHIRKMEILVKGGFNHDFLLKLHFDGRILNDISAIVEKLLLCRRTLNGLQ